MLMLMLTMNPEDLKDIIDVTIVSQRLGWKDIFTLGLWEKAKREEA